MSCEQNHMETRVLLMEMKDKKELEVCKMVISLAKQCIAENGDHDIRFKTRNSKGEVVY